MAEQKSNTEKDGLVEKTKTDSKDLRVTIDERFRTEDVAKGKARDLYITETDGHEYKFQMQRPTLQELEDINSERSVIIPQADGTGIVKQTNTKFYSALFTLFHGQIQKDGKNTGEQVGWDFFNNHEMDTYDTVVAEADRFLNDKFKPTV